MDNDDFMFLIKVIGGLIVFIFILGYGLNLLIKASCLESYANYEPTYGFIAGCRIEWEGKQTPTDMVKNINLNS